MSRGLLALTFETVYIAFVLAARVWLHHRRTGDWGIRLQRENTTARWCGVLFAATLLVGIVGAVLAATGTTELLDGLDRRITLIAGVVLFVVGFVITWFGQQAMGRSWRIGVDPSERTELVTPGLFGVVRNPIFTGMISAGIGLALIAPTWITIVAAFLLVVTIELQVRTIEEPHLRSSMPAWPTYATHTGRFVPLVGRIETRHIRQPSESPP